MKWFSERKGIIQPRTEIQIQSMDKALRNRLWNVFENRYVYGMYDSSYDSYDMLNGRYNVIENQLRLVMDKFFDTYLKEKSDTAPSNREEVSDFIRNFISEAEWNKVYDFFEFVVAHNEDKKRNEEFMKDCNVVLESELSAYRFVGSSITEVTSKHEISEIEEALSSPLNAVNAHIDDALKLMSDRKSPDYRNSIKESISAVEAICRLITNKKNASLGDALDLIKKEGKIEVHGALREAFDHLYGYTSGEEGIRHSLIEGKVNLNFEDAKFMLVSCSAFVNYLKAKISRAGMKIGS